MLVRRRVVASRRVEPVPRDVLVAFGAEGPAEELGGGMAPAYRVGDIVLKRAGDPVEAAYEADVMAAVQVDEARVRVARPVKAGDGAWIVDGWSASAFADGRLVDGPQPWSAAFDAADALHEALRDVAQAPFLATRTHRWAVAERVAWGEETADIDPRLQVLCDRLWPLVAVLQDRPQLIHGDLCRNLLFHAERPPAVIDFSPMWRPPAFTRAIYVVDALGWHGGDDRLLALISRDADTVACLARAGIFRLVALHGRARDLAIDMEPLLPEYEAIVDRLVRFFER